MYHTLSKLKDQVNQLIEQQGENATCASFIYTKEDVFYFEDVSNDELYLSQDDSDQVLFEVGNTDDIYTQIGELIDDEVGRVQNQVTT
jgi:hypothetical protein